MSFGESNAEIPDLTQASAIYRPTFGDPFRKGVLDGSGLFTSQRDTMPFPPYLPTEYVPVDIGAEMLQRGGPVKMMGSFRDLCSDPERSQIFNFVQFARGTNKSIDSHIRHGSMSEAEGLTELRDFIDYYLEVTHGVDLRGDDETPCLRQKAEGLRRGLSFLGQKEYDESVRCFATYWIRYLESNPGGLLCVLALTDQNVRYQGVRKSDSHLVSNAISFIGEDKVCALADRIIWRVEDSRLEQTENIKVVLPDDWVVSGRQMKDNLALLSSSPAFRRHLMAGRVEINLLAASQSRIHNGLDIEGLLGANAVPIKSYYMTHYSDVAQYEHESHITGLHSSVNYDFEEILEAMYAQLCVLAEQGAGTDQVYLPALACVERGYRYAIAHPKHSYMGQTTSREGH